MNKRNSFNKFFLVVFSLFLFSCSDNLLDSPKSEGDNDSTKVADSIDAPVNLTATNGGFKVIDLSWKSVRGAKSYLIFAADSPFDEYVQIWETGEISYSVSVPAGKSQFYKVQAKNYKDVLSSFSNVASGSSLARPVITAIEQNAEGNSATVNWWMENCTNSTYENLIRYTVKVYSADGSTVFKEVSVTGNETQVTIEGLEPKTKNLSLCNLKFRMEGLYPFLHQFNGMKQFAKQTILYGFDFFLGPYEEWKPFKYLTFNFAPGIHYMYQLSDEYHLNYLGIALNAGVEFPVFERWTFLLDGTFSWDNANLGTNKDIQPFDYSWQWQTTLGVRYSRKHLNGLNR